jgi:hypothetical protein
MCEACRKTAEAGHQLPPVVNTVACVSSKPLFSAVASRLQWPEQSGASNEQQAEKDQSVQSSNFTIFCGMNNRKLQAQAPSVWHDCWATQYVGLSNLCDKGNFARLVMVCQALSAPHTWDFNPRTSLLPEQYELVVNALQKGKHTYIFKPKDGAQGEGIFLAQTLPEFTSNMQARKQRSMVCQRYLEKPLLLDGFKFDFRMYVCLLGGSATEPPHVFVCREGLARFCTERYDLPSSGNRHISLAHLTNYSLNKASDKFEHGADEMTQIFDKGSLASKRPLTVVLSQIEAAQPGFDRNAFYNSVAKLVQTAFSAMAPLICAYHRCDGHDGDMRTMQILGIDVILDQDLIPYLLEINNSPSLRVSDPESLSKEDLRSYHLTEVSIEGGGTVSVNATYTEACLKQKHYLRSFLSRDGKHGLHCALAVQNCPAGWYITEEIDNGVYYNVYYNPNTHPNAIPQSGWLVYKGQYSRPGVRPLPNVNVIVDGTAVENSPNLCLCYDWEDVDVPHKHNISPVDLAVKSIVMEGAFQLLRQLCQRAQELHAEAYISVDVVGTDLCSLLTSVQALFIRCGGAEEAFSQGILHDILWPFLAEGALNRDDVDLLSCQSNYDYVSYTGHAAVDPLRLFDFVELLKKVGGRMYPSAEPRDALSLTLNSIRDRGPQRDLLGVGTRAIDEGCVVIEEEELADLQPLF